jgi:hypothetical protein
MADEGGDVLINLLRNNLYQKKSLKFCKTQ